jgi:putative endonuclease
MPYYVYMIQCDDGSFYTGYSMNLDRRMRQHMKGKGARYLRIHRPKRLVHVEEFESRAEAMRRERKVKLLSHSRKSGLARSGTRAKHGAKKMRVYRIMK